MIELFTIPFIDIELFLIIDYYDMEVIALMHCVNIIGCDSDSRYVPIILKNNV